MRIPVDNTLSPDVAEGLRQAGHDAVHVRELGLAAADDPVIFVRAAQDDRAILPADTDSGTLLALRAESKPSVILFRGAIPRRPSDQVALLTANLPGIGADIENGAIVIIEPTRIRIRTLPIDRP